MQVLLKTGRYAGELQDIRPDCANQMIADGRAIDPRIEPKFATGGIVSGNSSSFVIGEPLKGSFLPRAMVEKFEALMKAQVAPKSRKPRKVRT